MPLTSPDWILTRFTVPGMLPAPPPRPPSRPQSQSESGYDKSWAVTAAEGLVSQYRSVQGPAQSKTFDVLTHQRLAQCIMKAIQHGGRFSVSSQLISPCLVANICGVFSNRVLTCGYGGQPRAMAVACVVLKTLGASLTPREVFHVWN